MSDYDDLFPERARHDTRARSTKTMQVRIENPGCPGYLTQVTNAETGEALARCFRLEIDVSRGPELPIATLYTYAPVVAWTGEVDVREICPYCTRPLAAGERPDDDEK